MPDQQSWLTTLGQAFARPDTSQEHVRFTTASPLVNITDEDINRGINVALAAGPGSLKGALEGEIIPSGRAVADRVIEGSSGDHPAWAANYLPSPTSEIVYSRGNIALREGMSGGQRYYSGIKNEQQPGGGIIGTAYDIRNTPSQSKMFTEAEKAELAAAANRMEKQRLFMEATDTAKNHGLTGLLASPIMKTTP